eukprot:1523874-Rhodomonas_salina.2
MKVVEVVEANETKQEFIVDCSAVARVAVEAVVHRSRPSARQSASVPLVSLSSTHGSKSAPSLTSPALL